MFFAQVSPDVIRSILVLRMWPILAKTLRTCFLPGGLLFLAAIGFLRPQGLPDWVQGPVSAFPGIVLIFGVIFGWYFSSSRLILSFLVLSLAESALYAYPTTASPGGASGRTLFAVASILLPLNLLALSTVREDAIATWRGLLRLALILIQPALAVWLARPEQAELATAIQQPFLPTMFSSWTELSQPALLAFSGTLALLLLRCAVDQNPFDAGTLWAVMSTFIAFHGFECGWSPINFFSAAGLILFLSLIQASYRQTYRDALTGIPGKQAYEEALNSLGRRYVIAVAGIDQLKHYGGQHGRGVGEQLLRLVAPKLVDSAEPGTVFRLSGEEFMILFPGKTARETLAPLERVRKAVQRAVFLLRGRNHVREAAPYSTQSSGGDPLPLTLSIGVAEPVGSHDSPAQVAKAAYRALYEAKGDGGNQVKRDTVSTGVRRTPAASGKIVAYSELAG